MISKASVPRQVACLNQIIETTATILIRIILTEFAKLNACGWLEGMLVRLPSESGKSTSYYTQ